MYRTLLCFRAEPRLLNQINSGQSGFQQRSRVSGLSFHLRSATPEKLDILKNSLGDNFVGNKSCDRLAMQSRQNLLHFFHTSCNTNNQPLSRLFDRYTDNSAVSYTLNQDSLTIVCPTCNLPNCPLFH